MNPDLLPAIVALVSLAANQPKSDSILQTVRTRYAATALANTGCCAAKSCCGTPLTLSAALGYSAEELAAVPEGHHRHRTVHQSAGGLVPSAARRTNTRGALLHVMGGLLGSVTAPLSGLVIAFTGWTPIDPVLSLAIGTLILFSSLSLLREALHGLMEGAPFRHRPGRSRPRPGGRARRGLGARLAHLASQGRPAFAFCPFGSAGHRPLGKRHGGQPHLAGGTLGHPSRHSATGTHDPHRALARAPGASARSRLNEESS